jgi:hypothetical protein
MLSARAISGGGAEAAAEIIDQCGCDLLRLLQRDKGKVGLLEVNPFLGLRCGLFFPAAFVPAFL